MLNPMKYLHNYQIILEPMWEVLGVSFQECTQSIQQLQHNYLKAQHKSIIFK